MLGAQQYATLFKTGQYGRLYIVSGDHARGLTFHIQVLPESEEAIPNGPQNLCLNKNAVEVYGIIAGRAGWTESYGWLHKGAWVDVFNMLVKEKRDELINKAIERKRAIEREGFEDNKRQADLLSEY